MSLFTDNDIVELSLLRGLEIDELVLSGLLPEEQRFDESLLSSLHLSYPEMLLQIHTGSAYPAEQLQFEVENMSLPRLEFDSLRIELRKIVLDHGVTNNYEKWSKREDGYPFEFEMTALKLVQKTVEHLESLKKPQTTIEATAAKYKNDFIPESGLTRSVLTPKASHSSVLNKTSAEICAEIPEKFRILHIENVLRNDSHSDFLRCQQRIKERIDKSVSYEVLRKVSFSKGQPRHHRERAEMIQDLVTPRITFHGTPNHLVPSIVRYGFLRAGDFNPETGKPLEKRCGNTYGRGVYSSPSAEFSLSYSDRSARPTKPNGFWGLKLIVCATIMGVAQTVSREDNWRTQSEPYTGADSHVANRELEYIVFDRAQILPCYIIHLDWGEDNRMYFEDIPDDPTNWKPKKPHPKLEWKILAPGDKQRQKEALIAKAAKYFPYGYGPATGTSFVAEEVGEVDEDEENYGDYQKDRIDINVEEAKTDSTVWEWDVKKLQADVKDEYTEERLGKRKKASHSDADA